MYFVMPLQSELSNLIRRRSSLQPQADLDNKPVFAYSKCLCADSSARLLHHGEITGVMVSKDLDTVMRALERGHLLDGGAHQAVGVGNVILDTLVQHSTKRQVLRGLERCMRAHHCHPASLHQKIALDALFYSLLTLGFLWG
ncbi:hypothetical protein JB92DRAFT_2844147 [Gautieria morchelliformis]|nr:hypothetical protein JB92DRAFT_2844147 [Gautieria morchelliformis]